MLSGHSAGFAAWRVERRGVNELLLRDESLATRSWFWVQSLGTDGTRLVFDSAVIADDAPMHPALRLILSVHMLYSKALLTAARNRLLKRLQQRCD